MNREDIINMAAQAGIDESVWFCNPEALERFAALVAEQPKQEPVAWMFVNLDGECEQIVYGTPPTDDDSITPLYTAPPEDEALRRENERLREALKLALNSHGRMLMSDPPQDAWKFNRVDEVINAALRREET